MKYCPQCNAEFPDSADQCGQCGGALISEGEYRLMQHGERTVGEADFERVFTLENPFEADVISSALRREGIDFLITRNEETAYNGIFIPQKGWGEVRVPPQDANRAKSIIDEAIRSYESNAPLESNPSEEDEKDESQ